MRGLFLQPSRFAHHQPIQSVVQGNACLNDDGQGESLWTNKRPSASKTSGTKNCCSELTIYLCTFGKKCVSLLQVSLKEGVSKRHVSQQYDGDVLDPPSISFENKKNRRILPLPLVSSPLFDSAIHDIICLSAGMSENTINRYSMQYVGINNNEFFSWPAAALPKSPEGSATGLVPW